MALARARDNENRILAQRHKTIMQKQKAEMEHDQMIKDEQ